MSALPSPSPSLPADAHVDGMNCAMPRAPAELPAFGFQLDSWSIWAAMMLGVTTWQMDPARITSASYSAGMPATVDSLALDPRNAPMTARSTPSTASRAAMTGMMGRLMEAAPAMTRDAAMRTKFAAARAARTAACPVAFAPRTALAGARRCRQMNLADELTPFTPARAALKDRSRVVLPSFDAKSSSTVVSLAPASSIQPMPVDPIRLTLRPAFPRPAPMCLPIRLLALPFAANLPISSLGFASDSALGLPAVLRIPLPGRRARLPRFMMRRALPAVQPTPCMVEDMPYMPARPAISAAV